MNNRVNKAQKRALCVCMVTVLLYGVCGCTASGEERAEIDTEISRENTPQIEDSSSELEMDMDIYETEVEEEQAETESNNILRYDAEQGRYDFDVKWEENDDSTEEGNALKQELLRGDFEHLSGKYSDYREFFEADWESGDMEWRQIDLNGDGEEDFILQEARPISNTGQKRIIGIFTIEEDSIRCIMSDLNDSTEYSFCGPTGKLFYTAPNYGGVVDNEPYECYHYDTEGQITTDYELEILRVDSEMDEDYAKEWKSENPDMSEDGLYYFRYIGDEIEKLTREEWTNIYETETGLKYDSSDMAEISR
ncbi:MAG: hypothetical protein HDR17_07435 [Lachnospiraceae bacterium]|nr:hypothetical protein [Lachnospiraceae bacterium]